MTKSKREGLLPKMIDISEKPTVKREATAEGTIKLKPATIRLIQRKKIEKGDPISIATIGAIQAVKSTPKSLMMCHPIGIEGTFVEITITNNAIKVRAKVIARSKTGVEMEALNAVSNALLNIWDVVKKYEKNDSGQYPETMLTNIRVVKKTKEGYY
ncbi:MAG: cyclic pyranopterin monophosphate synthase MoaC [Nitrososphaerales archaeon]